MKCYSNITCEGHSGEGDEAVYGWPGDSFIDVGH